MSKAGNRICPVEKAGSLDHRLRRWFQNPRKILGPHLHKGMVALDFGCGPGFFSVEMAQMVGPSGRVIACDLQDGMLRKLGAKIQGTPFEMQIRIHQCEARAIGWSGHVDFILAFYVLHELPDQRAVFQEMASILKPEGRILVVEPPFHVSRAAFAETLAIAHRSGLMRVEQPRVFLSKAALLRKTT